MKYPKPGKVNNDKPKLLNSIQAGKRPVNNYKLK